MTLSELEAKLQQSREHGATDDSNMRIGKSGDLLIDLDPDREKGYTREFSIEVS